MLRSGRKSARYWGSYAITAIKSCIANRIKRNREMDQLSLFDQRVPFTDSK